LRGLRKQPAFTILAVLALAGYIFTTNPEGGGLAGIFHGASVHNAAVSSTLTVFTALRWRIQFQKSEKRVSQFQSIFPLLA